MLSEELTNQGQFQCVRTSILIGLLYAPLSSIEKFAFFSERSPELKQKFVFTNWVGIVTIKGAEEALLERGS